jgi:hypothetical protein
VTTASRHRHRRLELRTGRVVKEIIRFEPLASAQPSRRRAPIGVTPFRVLRWFGPVTACGFCGSAGRVWLLRSSQADIDFDQVYALRANSARASAGHMICVTTAPRRHVATSPRRRVSRFKTPAGIHRRQQLRGAVSAGQMHFVGENRDHSASRPRAQDHPSVPMVFPKKSHRPLRREGRRDFQFTRVELRRLELLTPTLPVRLLYSV